MILGQQLVGVNHNGLTMLLFILIKMVTFESIGPNIRLLIEFFLTVSGAGAGFSAATFGFSSSSSSSDSADRWRWEETFIWDLFSGLLWWACGADEEGGRVGTWDPDDPLPPLTGVFWVEEGLELRPCTGLGFGRLTGEVDRERLAVVGVSESESSSDMVAFDLKFDDFEDLRRIGVFFFSTGFQSFFTFLRQIP